MSRFDMNKLLERQDELFPFGKVTEDLIKYQKLIPDFGTLNIPSAFPKSMQAVINSINAMPKIDFGPDIGKLNAALGTSSLSKDLQLAIDKISPVPVSVNILMADASRLKKAVFLSLEAQRAIDKVADMHKAVDLGGHGQFDKHWNSIAELTRTLGLNNLSSISQSLALKADELNFEFSDVTDFESEDVDSAIDKLSEEGAMDDFLSALKKVKNNEDFKAYGFPIIWSLVMLWLGIYIGSLLAANNISEREVKRELKQNSEYYRADYTDSNFRVIARNGVRLRSEPKRIEETIIFELPAFTGVTIIERPSGRSSWVKVSLMLDGMPLEGWVTARYLQKIR